MDPKTPPEKTRKPRPQKPRLALTRTLKSPTEYAKQLDGEFAKWAFNEERAVQYKGRWRSDVFNVSPEQALDLEIGTGNGYHFAHLAKLQSARNLIGIELKYKPLVQSIRRALRTGAVNARILRYDAVRLEDLFAEGELNNIYIHFPDPWPKKRQWKHRLIQPEFLKLAYSLMRPGSFIDFKTDSADYFQWSLEIFKDAPFETTRVSHDLHRSEWQSENFVTHFEALFTSQGLLTHYARLEKKD